MESSRWEREKVTEQQGRVWDLGFVVTGYGRGKHMVRSATRESANIQDERGGKRKDGTTRKG